MSQTVLLLCAAVLSVHGSFDGYPDDFCYPSGFCTHAKDATFTYICEDDIYLVEYNDTLCEEESTRSIASSNDSQFINCDGTCSNFVSLDLWVLPGNDTECTTMSDDSVFSVVWPINRCQRSGGDGLINSCTDSSVTTQWYGEGDCSDIANSSYREYRQDGCHFFERFDYQQMYYLEVLHCGDSATTSPTTDEASPTIQPTLQPTETGSDREDQGGNAPSFAAFHLSGLAILRAFV